MFNWPKFPYSRMPLTLSHLSIPQFHRQTDERFSSTNDKDVGAKSDNNNK